MVNDTADYVFLYDYAFSIFVTVTRLQALYVLDNGPVIQLAL